VAILKLGVLEIDDLIFLWNIRIEPFDQLLFSEVTDHLFDVGLHELEKNSEHQRSLAINYVYTSDTCEVNFEFLAEVNYIVAELYFVKSRLGVFQSHLAFIPINFPWVEFL
jgi:hypothetical protein